VCGTQSTYGKEGGGGYWDQFFGDAANGALSTSLFTSNSYDYTSEEIYNLVLYPKTGHDWVEII
jgi:hypothetical protein